MLRPTLFAGPLLLYLVSAGVGVWVTRGEREAWATLAVTAVSLVPYSLLVRLPPRLSLGRWGKVAPLNVLFGLLPTAISLYFLLTNDWGHWSGKLPWLDAITRGLPAAPVNSGYGLDPNSAGGLIAAFLPVQFLVLNPLRQEGGYRWGRALAVFISVLGLLLSASRGAWIALGAVAVSWALWQLSRRLPSLRLSNWQRVGLWLVATAAVAGVGLAFLWSPWGESTRAVIEADRAVTWRNSLDLAKDYLFTGLGPGRYMMAYSSYTLLLHVGHTVHAHSLFLNTWLEQGLLGLIALGWLVVLAIWPQPTPSVWRGAALASLAVILLHGITDDAVNAFGARIAVLSLPLVLLASPALAAAAAPATPRSSRVARYSALVVAGGLAMVVLSVVFVPQMQAAFLANLGAVAQSQVELSTYSWPEWSIQDAVRRARSADLSPAIRYYQAALVFDPRNATANRRLGQIELSLGEYDAACEHVRQAYQSAPGQRATRQMLGECYAITGDMVDAAKMWRTIEISQQQIILRQFWYESVGDLERSEWLRQAAALVQSP